MKLQVIGKGDIEISSIGLGCMGMSQGYGPGDDEESIKTLNRALDLGINFLDTAAVYGNGANERLVGRAIKDRRSDVILATKCGVQAAAVGIPSGLDGSPDEIRRSCDESLKRLSVDVIDLFYLHRVDPKTPIEDSVGSMAELVHAGKVRYLGLSEAAPATIFVARTRSTPSARSRASTPSGGVIRKRASSRFVANSASLLCRSAHLVGDSSPGVSPASLTLTTAIYEGDCHASRATTLTRTSGWSSSSRSLPR